ncbi:hypothetical protein IMZ48_16410 [Candidatus Bathyarchaeota archaeon]|nr:hypothetical protein [Candidatus Bathyarchaeota archaeon]
MENVFSGVRSDFRYSYLDFKHNSFCMGTHDTNLCNTGIAMRDTRNFKVTECKKPAEILPFNPAVEKVPASVNVITFGAVQVDHNANLNFQTEGI